MPALGMAQDIGKLVSWLKGEGDHVSKGQPIMEIETDKATVEIEAPDTGFLSGIRAQEGEDVPVGQGIAWILAPGERSPEESAEITRLTPASPKARRLAREHDINLEAIASTGPESAALSTDVRAYLADQKAQIKADWPPVSSHQIEVSHIWKVMADRLASSWREVPHFYLLREVNASRLVAWRKRLSASAVTKITYTDLLVKLVSAALLRHPEMNVSWQNGSLLVNEGINIGIAVAVEEGLVVPVIPGASELSLTQIAQIRQDLVEKAQSRKLRREDFQDGSITISNLGMYGVDVFNAVVNSPQASLLAVGRIAERVIPLNGQPAIRPVMMFSLACDHRAVDGARAAKFLQTIVDLIEEPLGIVQ